MFSKVCSTCHESKSLSDFSLKRSKPQARCKACVAIYYKNYREQNQDKVREQHRRHWEQYKGTERQKEVNRGKCKRYQEQNLDRFRAYAAKRRASEGRATPPWADMKRIYEIYSNCPAGYEVDHVVPLSNKNVCGLHVENNLQYLTSTENKSKSNKFL